MKVHTVHEGSLWKITFTETLGYYVKVKVHAISLIMAHRCEALGVMMEGDAVSGTSLVCFEMFCLVT